MIRPERTRRVVRAVVPMFALGTVLAISGCGGEEAAPVTKQSLEKAADAHQGSMEQFKKQQEAKTQKK